MKKTLFTLACLCMVAIATAQAAKMFKGQDCELLKREGWILEKNNLFSTLQ